MSIITQDHALEHLKKQLFLERYSVRVYKYQNVTRGVNREIVYPYTAKKESNVFENIK